MVKYGWDLALVAVGAGAVGFGVAFWVYHKNKVTRAAVKAKADFDALVAKVKAEINTPAA